MSVFGDFMVRIFPHSDWIRRDVLRISTYSVRMRENTDQTRNTNTFHAVEDFTISSWKLSIIHDYIETTQNKQNAVNTI